MKPRQDKAAKTSKAPAEKPAPVEQPGDVERETPARNNNIEREDRNGPVE